MQYHHSNLNSNKMPLQEIDDILAKYKAEEDKIDNLFKEIAKPENGDGSNSERRERKFLSLEEAKERNSIILKDLETVKGNLRSKAIFSPTEMQWEQICKRYQDEPALPVTTWRCNIPIFV